MPPVRPLSPAATRTLLEANGYEVVDENEYSWAFASRADEVPIMVPHNVPLLPLEVAQHVMRRVGFDIYAEALAVAGDEPFPPDEE